MTKYEFVWAVAPRALAGRERTDKIGPFEIEIASDRIVARTDFTDIPEATLHAEAAAIVENLARAIAFQEKRQVTAVPSNITRISESGSVAIAIAPPAAMVAAVGKIGVVIQGPDGEIVSSSAADEFKAAQALAERAARSAPLQRMLDDMQVFYTDAEKKLAPLYNVLKAADTQLGGRKNAAATLKISRKKLDELGRICNDTQILNARHPGEGTSGKRPATPQQLELCQRIAETIIHRFTDTV